MGHARVLQSGIDVTFVEAGLKCCFHFCFAQQLLPNWLLDADASSFLSCFSFCGLGQGNKPRPPHLKHRRFYATWEPLWQSFSMLCAKHPWAWCFCSVSLSFKPVYRGLGRKRAAFRPQTWPCSSSPCRRRTHGASSEAGTWINYFTPNNCVWTRINYMMTWN